MATAAEKQLEQTKDLIITAVQETYEQRERAESNASYERQELRRWAIEQTIAAKPETLVQTVDQITAIATDLITWVKADN